MISSGSEFQECFRCPLTLPQMLILKFYLARCAKVRIFVNFKSDAVFQADFCEAFC